VLRFYVLAKKFVIHDFVVMPNHLHVSLTVDQEMSVEKAVQLIKGNFSYRAKKELGVKYEIWQRGFSEVRIFDRESFLHHREYIDQNPVKAGLANSPEEYPFGSAYFRARKAAKGLKPNKGRTFSARLKSCPDTLSGRHRKARPETCLGDPGIEPLIH